MGKCKVCQASGEGKSYSVREMMFGFKTAFNYFECNQCGCLQLEEVPADIARYYDSSNYYSFGHKKSWINFALRRERAKYYMQGGLIGKIIAKRKPSKEFEAIGKLKPSKETAILDVGCGDGETLHLLSTLGYSRLLGIDPYIRESVKYETGLEVKKIAIEELAPEKKWDIIMLHHVFEHVTDPLQTLIRIQERLAPNGVALIRIPTSSSYAWKHYRENWFQIDAPRHTFLHSRKSMETLVDQSGLKVKEYYYDSSAMQFWASEQYLSDIPLMSEKSYVNDPQGGIFTAKQIQDYAIKSERLNAEQQGDQVVYILER